jgi:hypothetical protein
MLSFIVLVSFFASSMSLVMSAGAAQDGGSGKTVNLQIIVDSSGSMAAPTDTGVIRMDAAKIVLNEVIAQLPVVENVNVGLRVYGHRGDNTDAGRPESCLSSDLLVPMNGVDPAALTPQVNSLQPVGWTPIGYSLQQAASDFSQPASDDVVNAIVLVTDGLETCDADPVAISGELRNSDKGIITHVIGFGTTPEEQAILSGIAERGEGQLFGSNNAGQLMDALFSVLEELEVVEASGTGSSLEDPIALGRIGQVGAYDVSVIQASVDETQDYAPGMNAFVARVSVTYKGEGSGRPADELSFNAVGQMGSSYTLETNPCGTFIQQDISSINELFPGGSAEFNICWLVDERDATSMLMFVDSVDPASGDRIWFSLVGEDGQPSDAVSEPTQAEVLSTSGTGTQVEPFTIAEERPYLVTLELATWSGNSVVVSIESLAGTTIPNGVFQGNAVGTTETVVILPVGEYTLNVRGSSDPWTVTIAPLERSSESTNGGEFSGTGNQVHQFSISQEGSYLVRLDLATWSGNSVIVSIEAMSGGTVPNSVFQGNAVGTTETVVMLPVGEYMLNVQSKSDPWTVTIAPLQ